MNFPLATQSHMQQIGQPRIRDDNTTIQESDKRNGSGQDGNISFPLPDAYPTRRHRAAQRISPPPLKRQRTDNDVPTANVVAPRPTELPARPCLTQDVVRRSLDGLPTFQQRELNRQQDRKGLWKYPHSLPNPPTTHGSGKDSVIGKARNSDAAVPRHSAVPRVTVKRACPVCKGSSATNYNPIFICQGCASPYHDSCRKPPLGDLVEPQHWRCSNCLSCNRARISTAPSAQRDSNIRHGDPSAATSSTYSKLSTCSNLDDDQTLVSLSSEAEPSPKWVNSFALPDRSSQPLLVQPGQQTEAPSSVGDSRFACNTAEHGNASNHDNMSIWNILRGPNEARSSNSINRRDNSDYRTIPFTSLHASDYDFEQILNTPTQHSRASEVPDQPFDARLGNEREAHSNDDKLTARDRPHQPAAGITAMRIVLCVSCRAKRVFATCEDENIYCHTCRNRSLIAESDKLETPDTYHAASHNEACATQSPKDGLSSTSPAVFTSNPVKPWFHSNLINPKLKIKRKKIDHDVILSMEHARWEPSLGRYESNDNFQANISGEILVRKEPSVEGPVPMLDTCVRVSKAHVMEKMEDPVPTEAHLKQPKNDSNSPPPIVMVRSCRTNDNDLSLESTNATDEEVHDAGDEDLQLKLTGTESTMALHARSVSSDTWACSEQVVKHPRLKYVKLRHTARELAIIALSAADDSGLTAVEVINWIAKAFPLLRKGRASWETRVETKLSALPELFRSEISGTRDNTKRYSFVDASMRKRYRALYAKYWNGITTPVSEAGESSRTYVKSPSALNRKGQAQSIRVRNTASSRDDDPPVKPSLSCETLSATKATPVMPSEDLIAPFMPFERAVKRKPQVDLSILRDSKRETSYKAFLQAQPSSIEFMTEEEKAKKIAQIKARPSRKQFFGSDYRLGHVRRYGRQDIHDESDGAWIPPLRNMHTGDVKGNGKTTRTFEGPTLREVFDLPEHAIPMNDGQTELAFRDGTKINGRLPRSRQIYKVGKMFGGELTVRAS